MGDWTGAGEIAKQAVELVKAKPIYEDTVRPGAVEIGKAGETVGKAINAALMPFRVMIWGFDRIEAFLMSELPRRLSSVPPASIVSPSPQVFGPAVEALRFSGENATLSAMYAGLIATAMDARQCHLAHPAYPEILKQMTPHEAKMLKAFGDGNYCVIRVRCASGPLSIMTDVVEYWADLGKVCDYSDDSLAEPYLVNLMRLGLIEIDMQTTIHGADEEYAQLAAAPYIDSQKARAKENSRVQSYGEPQNWRITNGVVVITRLGMQLLEASGVSNFSATNR